MSVFRRCILLVLLVLGLAPAAGAARRQAEEDPVTARAKIHLESGVAYFNEGKFADAEREMTQAYALRPVPELKYNLAQCQERIGALDRAADSYRAYLKGRPGAADRAEVEKRIAQLEEQLRAQAAAPPILKEEPAPGPAAALAAPPPAVAATPPEKVVFKEIVVYKAPPPKAGRTARIFGYALLGLTAVGLASGLAFTLTATNISRDVQTASDNFQATFSVDPKYCTSNRMMIGNAVKDKIGPPAMPDPTKDPVKEIAEGFCSFYNVSDDARRLNMGASVIGYGLAGLSAVGALGTFLYARHLDKKQERELAGKSRLPNLSMTPVFGATGGGVSLAGDF